MILYSGTSNKKLSQRLTNELDISLGKIKISRFIDSECHVRILDEPNGDHVYVLQSLSEVADQNLFELCLIGQALKPFKPKKVTAIIPWMGYSKQDKVFQKGETASVELIAKFIETAGFSDVVTLELHSENITPYFNIPVTEISTHELLTGSIESSDSTIIVSPDKGGQKRSETFARQIDLPIVYLDKKRDLESGSVKIIDASSEVKGKDAVIFDDIINTGSTAIKVSEYLHQEGARSVTFLATHPVLAGDASNLLQKSSIKRVIVTDTIEVKEEKRFDKLQVVSVSSLIAEHIRS